MLYICTCSIGGHTKRKNQNEGNKMENMKEAVKKLNAETKANWILDDGCASPTIKVIGAEEGDDYSITEAGLNWEVACTGYTQQFGNLEDAVNHIINTQND